MMNNTRWIIAVLFVAATIIQCQQSKTEDHSTVQTEEVTTPDNALEQYLQQPDDSYGWELENTVEQEESTLYQLALTSQTWRDLVWEHSLSIVIPRERNEEAEDALLFISGGHNKGTHLHPDADDGPLQAITRIARENRAVTALIKQVPNQPLFGGKTEDEIISYTLHNYKEDGDFTWPLLFPMVKSVVKGMDAVQAFAEQQEYSVRHFLLTGYSKRGWTSWLAGASDERVKAIAPSVIDVLNMPLNVDYQVKTWGDYSVEIQDYVRLGIAQDISSPSGKELVTMIDPFSYREKLDMPKLILIGTNDPYWPADAVKHYFNQLPGENYIFYTPDAGHDLRGGEEATPILSEFFNDMLSDAAYPEFQYDYTEEEQGFSISITSDQPVASIERWTAHSTDRDFRDEKWSVQQTSAGGTGTFSATVHRPQKGYLATYWNVVYEGDLIPRYPLSTRMFVAGKDSVYLDAME
ncbi:PhoPQ-activated pathogenicity-related protein [Fodinibius roseus]|uniref:PhoPQ-activated pathogenicity-related protein n=1 Tax=Fodinibius roseus TaxID=1194090 RepID=A0A1M4YJ96_9BACT|nr:PhoPQ-activated protein PqaA family protein [Fodinibius roseus]SHF05925.1 PhoPQ-activated pathogenicity-related protein [Fodinibius roseus]